MRSAVNEIKTERIASSLSWIIFVLFVVVFVNMMELPRIPIEAPDKDALRNFHIATGSLLFACSCFRVHFWLQSPPQKKQDKLPIEAYKQLHVLQFSLYCAFIGQGLTGIVTAWSDGLMQFLPGATTANHALWVLSGYLHSVFAFFYSAIILFIALTGFYHMIRYRVWRFSIFA